MLFYCERHGDALPALDIDTWNVEPCFDKVLVDASCKHLFYRQHFDVMSWDGCRILRSGGKASNQDD